ncbi:nck-associated protein 1-like [Sycon ciliatum]|uniref:nck-associated protein 1-like n=1 Tax=Sycon ciliatum TaxID=27933 RepID=UPI0020AD6C12|eukprot:scpid20150/ scgid21448/ Nck-associated protein 1; Membrane-associated protein HEM-2; p125Nap1
MSLPSLPEQKIAEKLSLLNSRGSQLLHRLYNLKKNAQDRLGVVLQEKTFESAIKYISRKFPTVEIRGNAGLNVVHSQRSEILKFLQIPYDLFKDFMEFKDKAMDLFNQISTSQIRFDIALNFDLCKGYLDLVCLYCQILLIVPRIEERKTILGLYHCCHEYQHGTAEASYPRIAQLVHELEHPHRKIVEDLQIFGKQVGEAILTLRPIYMRRMLPTDQMKTGNLLSLTYVPQHMLNPTQCETMPCEYLSLDVYAKWIIFGFLACPQQVSNSQECLALVKIPLHENYVIPLCRDEVMAVHPAFETVFKLMKMDKAEKWLHESAKAAVLHGPRSHVDRRNYLRNALSDLVNILGDQPGLLGPKALVLLMALSLARDEIAWLVRHADAPIPKMSKTKVNPDDMQDRQLPELLFYMHELRALAKKYQQVLRRYFVQYMNGFDHSLLSEVIQKIINVGDDESVIMTSFLHELSTLDIKAAESGQYNVDFSMLRLDWMRLQAYMSAARSQSHLHENRQLAFNMNTVVFHSRMVDQLQDILDDVSDLSFLYHYPKILEYTFSVCSGSNQARYVIAVPLTCAMFLEGNCMHCPEERGAFGERSVKAVNHYLELISKDISGLFGQMCDEYVRLNGALLPFNATNIVKDQARRANDKSKKHGIQEFVMPGRESERKARENYTRMDTSFSLINDLCYTLNHFPTIVVWGHTFVPREFLLGPVEEQFVRILSTLLKFQPEAMDIARPTEVLTGVIGFMTYLRSVENFVNIDMTRVFNVVLLQQTQPLDAHGNPTLCSQYTAWYLESLLRRVSTSNICYSPSRKSFISNHTVLFKAEVYSDPQELKALCELLGPYGIRYLGDKCMHQVMGQVLELKKMVTNNKETLHNIRTNYDKPEVCNEMIKRLKGTDEVLQRMTIIGIIINFRKLLMESMHSVLKKRIPFMIGSILDFKEHFPAEQDSMVVDEMATSAGIECTFDPILAQCLRGLCDNPQTDYVTWCLLMVFVAVGLPNLAFRENSLFRPTLEGHENNAHCIVAAINYLSATFFTLTGNSTVSERMNEFLALATSSLLKLGQLETEKEMPKNRESVYILLGMLVQESPFLTMDLLESCFPYALLRNSYNQAYKKKPTRKREVNTDAGY